MCICVYTKSVMLSCIFKMCIMYKNNTDYIILPAIIKVYNGNMYICWIIYIYFKLPAIIDCHQQLYIIP